MNKRTSKAKTYDSIMDVLDEMDSIGHIEEHLFGGTDVIVTEPELQSKKGNSDMNRLVHKIMDALTDKKVLVREDYNISHQDGYIFITTV